METQAGEDRDSGRDGRPPAILEKRKLPFGSLGSSLGKSGLSRVLADRNLEQPGWAVLSADLGILTAWPVKEKFVAKWN